MGPIVKGSKVKNDQNFKLFQMAKINIQVKVCVNDPCEILNMKNTFNTCVRLVRALLSTSVIFLLTVRVNRDTCVTWPYVIGLTFYCNDIHCRLKHNFEGSCSLCGA